MEDAVNKDKSLLEMMECPVCLKYITKPPIRHCEHGHIICGECIGQLGDCPTCRGVLLMSRNRIAEELIRKLLYPCENVGCNSQLLVQELEGHAGSCMYRECKCLVPACVWTGSQSNLQDHLLQTHREITANIDTGEAYFGKQLG